MNDDLYFIPILAKALEQPDVETALRTAFAEIEEAGRQPQYQRGHQQFLRFMREAGAGDPQQVAEQLLHRFGREFERPNVLELILEGDGKLVAKFNLSDTSAPRVTESLKPGAYCLRCDTGRVLWEGRLADSDLLWAKAFPGKPLEMAADTGHSRAKPTQSIALLHGTLVLRIFAGIGHGMMEVEQIKA